MKTLSYMDQIFTEVNHQTIFWPSISGEIVFVQKDGKQGRQTIRSKSSFS